MDQFIEQIRHRFIADTLATKSKFQNMRLFNIINNDLLKKRMLESDEKRTTLSFYKYAHIDQPEKFRNDLYVLLSEIGVFGRIYVAHEGVNAQISVPTHQLEELRRRLYSIPFLDGVRLNIAVDDNGKSFYKLKIKLRPKIVADGLDDRSFDVTQRGTPVDAETFNRLASDPDTIIVDMRNHYESEVGHFKGAICPEVATFREALPKVEQMLADKKDKNIVMYCTGGIRCEKASAYFLHKGFKKVFMLDGGIIEYARQCREKNLPNLFVGKNFVFDERLGERISPEVIARCHQCGRPCDTHVNCANEACHLLFIQCEECAEKYHNCCSSACAEFIQLSAEQREVLKKSMVFNGTKFSKGHYKAWHSAKGPLTES